VGSVFALLSRYAVNFWSQGLHQPASLSVAPGERMAMVFKLPLYVSMLGFGFLFLALLLAGTRTEIRARRLRVLLERERAG
jgi:heme exporter protein C